ncbi:MAG: 4Fe-4S binding protein [Bacteroidales bacterium]|nr:4Fe-4S binding protein [Bacteroidales bacterium]
MDRKEFLTKSAGLVIISGLSVLGISAQEKTNKKYTVIDKRCDGCGHCFRACRDKALTATNDRKAVIDSQKCIGCGDCVRFCRRMAIVEIEENPKA